MSKRSYVARYSLILRKLQLGDYPSWKEIKAYVERELEMMRLQDESIKPEISKRTFDRDKEELRNAFGMEIRYSTAKQGYYIEENAYSNQGFERVTEAFDTFNALRLSQDISRYIHLEQRKPQGTEHLSGIIYAIKNKRQLAFDYRKFYEEDKSQRTVDPHALKEFRNRWYLLATENGMVKTFGLDRISKLDIRQTKLEARPNFNPTVYFKDAFGVITGEGQPEEVILDFTSFQGQYIKSLPLHHSQKVLAEKEDLVRVRLFLHPTYDFKMELLSMGPQVKVLEPESLKTEIVKAHHEALKNYQ